MAIMRAGLELEVFLRHNGRHSLATNILLIAHIVVVLYQHMCMSPHTHTHTCALPFIESLRTILTRKLVLLRDSIQLILPSRPSHPAGQLPLRSIVSDTLAFLLFISLLQNGLSPTGPRSTILYTLMTTIDQHNVRDGQLNHLQKRLFIVFSLH